jgi:hypothetical protein
VEQPTSDQARPVATDRPELLTTLRELLADPLVAEVRAERDTARAEAAELRDRTVRAEVEAARMKGELAAKDALVAELQARAERAEAALLRLLEALRRG